MNVFKTLTVTLLSGTLAVPLLAQPADAPPARELQAEAKLQAELAAARDAARASGARAVQGEPLVFWRGKGGKKEKVAFLGITSTRVDRALRTHLKMPRGIGLVVQSVEEKTPAGEAGVLESDILQKLDDQWLVTSEQLGILIRMHNPGDEVTLAFVREGQPQTLKVKLGEREMVVTDGPLGMTDGSDNLLEGLTALAPSEGQFSVAGTDLEKVFPGQLLTLAGADDDADLIYTDDQHTFKITTDGDEKHLNVTDSADKVLFDGAIQTDEQRAKLPAEIAEKLKKVEEKMKVIPEGTGKQRIRIHMNGAGK